MIMNVNNLRELIKKAAGENREYTVLTTHFDFLMQERIKITQNTLRSLLGRQEETLEKEKIIQSVKAINKIATEKGVDFHIQEDWDSIEAFLRMSVMEDIAGEFKKQENS